MIEVSGIVKNFGTLRAVDGVSFRVEPGQIAGFLGPNGAGKSTTMRVITGYLPPDAGMARICGHSVKTSPIQARAAMGYLPENAPMYSEMSVLGFLGFAAELRGMSGETKRAAVRHAAERCHLEGVLEEPIETLSKGYRHRTALAQAILHNPPVLILDEPTDGLDPNQKSEARALIRELGRDKAILLSTHLLEELETVCTRALIIHKGRLVAGGTPEELKQQSPGAGNVILQFSPGAELPSIAALAGHLRGVCVCAEPEAGFRLIPESGQPPEEILRAALGFCHEHGLRTSELRIDEGNLEKLFKQLTTEPAR